MTTALKIPDLDPTTSLLHWVGYRYEPKSDVIRVEIVTKGHPRYDLFQEKNQKKQSEIVIRFLNTSLRPKIRRDIDASEFLSPVAYIRMRPNLEEQHVDVIITLRDQVKPKLFAQNGNVMLTFKIPDHYFGKSALGQSPVAKAAPLSDRDIFPELAPGSEAPQGFIVIEAIPKDPGTQAFQGVSDQVGTPVEAPTPPPQNAALDQQGLPPSFNNTAPPVENPPPPPNAEPLPVEANQPLSNNPITNNPINSGANLEGGNGSNIPQSNPSTNNFGQKQEAPLNQPQGEETNGELENTDDGSEEEAPLDDDSLKDFDDGDGDSSNTIDKFDVRLRPQPTHLVIKNKFTIFAVAQDQFNQQEENGGEQETNNAENQPQGQGNFGDGQNFAAPANGTEEPPTENFGANSGTNQTAVNAGSPPNIPANPAAGNVPVETMNIPAEPNPATALAEPPPPLTPPPPAPVEAIPAVTPPPAEPPLQGSPDLTGQEQVGQDSGVAPPPTAGGNPTKLDFRQALLSEVMRVLSAETGTNFVIPVGIGARRINISMANVPAGDALKAILDSELLGIVPLGPNLVRVDSLENIARAREEEERRRLAEQRLTPTKILVYRMNYGRATTALPLVKEMLTITAQGDNRIGLQVDERTNSIIVNAPEPSLNMAKALLQRIDLVTPQVKIASRIVEVFKNSSDNLGISWGGPFNFDQGRGLGFGNLVFPNSLVSRYSVDNRGLEDKAVNLRSRIGSINNGIAFDLALSMEEALGTGEVLQSGNLIVEDNQPANIVAGTSDFFRIAGANGGTELREVQYNLNMTVTPHITTDGAVQMQIRITSDTPGGSASGDAVARRNNRSINTTLLRRNGETAVIGGIYTTNYSKSRSGVPILSSLPIIGALFRSSAEVDEKKELLVMVTPTVVSPGKEGATGSGGFEGNGANSAPSNGTISTQLNTGSGGGNNAGQATFSNANFGNNAGGNQSQGQEANVQQGLENNQQSNQGQNQGTNQQSNLGQNAEE